MIITDGDTLPPLGISMTAERGNSLQATALRLCCQRLFSFEHRLAFIEKRLTAFLEVLGAKQQPLQVHFECE